MSVLVTGATGNVGSAVARALLARGEDVRGLSRGAAPQAATGVDWVAGDLAEPSTLGPALAGVETVFLLSGYDETPALADRLLDAGVRRVVLLSGNGAASTNPDNVITAYMRASERAVEAAGVEWTILRPFELMSNTLRWRRQLATGDTVRVPFAELPTAVVDPEDVAAVAAEALCDDRLVGERLTLTGPTSLLPAQRVGQLGRALGRDLRLVALSDEEAAAELSAAMPAAYVKAFFDFSRGGSIDEANPLPTVEDVLGRPPRTFRDWARDHAFAFPTTAR